MCVYGMMMATSTTRVKCSRHFYALHDARSAVAARVVLADSISTSAYRTNTAHTHTHRNGNVRGALCGVSHRILGIVFAADLLHKITV